MHPKSIIFNFWGAFHIKASDGRLLHKKRWVPEGTHLFYRIINDYFITTFTMNSMYRE